MNAPLRSCPTCGGGLVESLGDSCPRCLLGANDEAPEIPPFEVLSAVGGHELLRLIGRGGMGMVYEGVSENSEETVAVKVLSNTLATNAEFVERFMRESQALGDLDHPNIVRSFGSGQDGGVPYHVMEFVDGKDLARHLEKGALEPAQALRIARDVCAALVHAHSRKIGHRDIKPSNILVDDKGKAKVADFGLARIFNRRERSDYSLTLSGASMGTPYYIAPEQLRDTRAADDRADLYSLGVVLYEMLTGELPTGQFAPPSTVVLGLPRKLDRLMARALQPKPESRYQSAEEMLAALEAVPLHGGLRTRWERWMAGAALLALLAWGGHKLAETRKDGDDGHRSQAALLAEDGLIVLQGGSRVAPKAAVWIARDRVTRAEWGEVMPDWPLNPTEGDGTVVTGVSWHDAKVFCDRKTLQALASGNLPEGYAYRLPTEEEWQGFRAEFEANTPPKETEGGGLEWCEDVPHDADADPEVEAAGFGLRFHLSRIVVDWGGAPPSVLVLAIDRSKPITFRVVLAPKAPVPPDEGILDPSLVTFGEVESPRKGAPAQRNGLGMEFVGYDRGTIRRSLDSERMRGLLDEGNTTTLTKGFWLGKTEVTAEQYARVTGIAGPAGVSGENGAFPVGSVTCLDAWFFCARLTELEREAGILPPSMRYALPSLAQWRLAVEAGFEGGWPGPDAHSSGQVYVSADGLPRAAGAGSPDASGLFDLLGNAAEWLTASSDPTSWEGSDTDPRAVSTAFWLPRGMGKGGCEGMENAEGRWVSFALPLDAAPGIGFRVALVSTEVLPATDSIEGAKAREMELRLEGSVSGLMGESIKNGTDGITTWMNWNDSAYWLVRGLPAGRYEVLVEYGSPFDDHPYEVTVGNHVLAAKTRRQGSYANGGADLIGSVDLAPGSGEDTVTRIEIKPTLQTSYGFANVYGLSLRPVK